MPKILSVLLLMFLSSCGAGRVNSANYNNRLQSWIGASQGMLTAEWGQPDNVFYLTPDKYIVTYIKMDNSPVDGKSDPYTGEVYYPALETPNYNFSSNGPDGLYYCKTSFTIENNQVVDYTFNGDDCVAEGR